MISWTDLELSFTRWTPQSRTGKSPTGTNWCLYFDKLELNDKEKIKLRQDAGIIDVDFLEESHAEDHSQ